LSSLRGSLDALKEAKGKSVIVMAGNFEEKAMLIISVSKDLIDSVDARNLLESCAEIIGAKGGGRSDYAQAGGDRVDKIDDALQASKFFFNK
jgi:alanyl-tRNA synthetase